MEMLSIGNKNKRTMKIGIITFHWATNYGAVLQCFALQTYLISIGHQVKVINYKPHQFDESFFKFLKYGKFLHLRDYICSLRKEKVLKSFRSTYLNQTKRIYKGLAISSIANEFDMIISGSDQVTNPSFLMSGEGKGIVSPAYFLGFPFKGKRVGYALSFGCIDYPEEARIIASKYIKAFDKISVRELTGINIIKSMERYDAVLVPDPTLLMPPEFYHTLADQTVLYHINTYVYCYFIRHIAERKSSIHKTFNGYEILWDDEDRDYTMQGWLCKIRHSKIVISDSYHCVIMCLKLHIPFIAITDKRGNIGMNDRLYTLLNKLDLCQQICFKDDISNYSFHWDYDWGNIDKRLMSYANIGKDFLSGIGL